MGRKTLFFTWLLLIMIFMASCSARPQQLGNISLEKKDLPEAQSELRSAQVFEPLPWSEGEKVELFKQKYNTPILMGAYRATLSEPILNEAHNIALAANTLAGTVVQPGEVFSQTRRLAPYSQAKGYKEGPAYSNFRVIPAVGGGVCKIASMLYNVTILCNLKVVERHPHSMPVPYVPPGQDATVTTGVHDFRFKNTTQGPILIWAEKIGNTLIMAFYGQETPPKVTWGHETLKRFPFDTVTRYNPSLSPGTEKEVLSGAEGLQVRSWIIIEGEDGATERKDLGIDYYESFSRVIEKGPKER